MKRTKVINRQEQFEVRSQVSCSNQEKSRCLSVESEEAPAKQLSDLICEMICEEKKKYMPSKTDNRMLRSGVNIKTRRFYSVSNVAAEKPLMQLPQHIGRILNSSKRYPQVPNLERNDDGLDTIYGAFFGFLIGDVVGSYMAYAARDFELFIPAAMLMNGGGTYNLGPGQGTDQTQIMLSLCYGLIEGGGVYNKNLVATKYMQWFESKPFNFSAVFALAMKELRRRKVEKISIEASTVGQTLQQSSLRNKNQQSSLGLIRILPLTLFALKFDEADFEKLLRNQLSLLCPNQLVIESGIVYGRILRVIFLTRDQERAFYEASKWVYQHGSTKLIELWKAIEKGIDIPSRGNMGKLKTSFTYSCIEINKKYGNFVDSMIRILVKGGDTETNCAVVMTLMGAVVGYNGIPGYLKQKIVNSRMKDSPRPRPQRYATHNVIDIIEGLRKVQRERYSCAQ